jgi:hypothetical protein
LRCDLLASVHLAQEISAKSTLPNDNALSFL